jgi:hypothetical protein
MRAAPTRKSASALSGTSASASETQHSNFFITGFM